MSKAFPLVEDSVTPGRMRRIVSYLLRDQPITIKALCANRKWFQHIDESSCKLRWPRRWDGDRGRWYHPTIHYELVHGVLYVHDPERDITRTMYVGDMFDGPKRKRFPDELPVIVLKNPPTTTTPIPPFMDGVRVLLGRRNTVR